MSGEARQERKPQFDPQGHNCTLTANSAYLIYFNKNVCSMFSLKVANIVMLEAILFMLIRWSKRQNSAWEQGKSNSAYHNYAKKSGSQLLLRNASFSEMALV